MFIVGNATYRYHQRSKEFKPTENDWEEWLEGLPKSMAVHMRKEGFEKCKLIWSFTRYVMEKNDIGLAEYIKENLDPRDYQEYQDIKNLIS